MNRCVKSSFLRTFTNMTSPTNSKDINESVDEYLPVLEPLCYTFLFRGSLSHSTVVYHQQMDYLQY